MFSWTITVSYACNSQLFNSFSFTPNPNQLKPNHNDLNLCTCDVFYITVETWTIFFFVSFWTKSNILLLAVIPSVLLMFFVVAGVVVVVHIKCSFQLHLCYVQTTTLPHLYKFTSHFFSVHVRQQMNETDKELNVCCCCSMEFWRKKSLQEYFW